MKKRWYERMERMAESFRLPIDAAVGALRIEILSGCEVLVENHRGLLDFDDNMICIGAAHHLVKINGSKLKIIAMDQSQLRVSGKISSVELS
ncbi:MAG: hypothetical protein GXX89_04915 [Clostridiales bacterium]|nr:hypothetical protein [Clostridiales bacterium]